MMYAIWFVGKNIQGLPPSLIKRTEIIDGTFSNIEDSDTIMTQEQIEQHCNLVHKGLEQWGKRKRIEHFVTKVPKRPSYRFVKGEITTVEE